jgi:hypothetical protein
LGQPLRQWFTPPTDPHQEEVVGATISLEDFPREAFQTSFSIGGV